MKFFDRTQELSLLREIREKSLDNAQLTVITGRRRVGKTQLIKAALGDRPYLYFYVSRKSEKVLCAGFQQQIQEVLDIPVLGTTERIEELIKFIFEISVKTPVTLVFDEFQEFYRVEPSIFSSLAALWDAYEKTAKLNLIVCGSMNRLINKIFRDSAEPLYGRNTASIKVEPFKISVLKDILAYHKPNYSNEDLLALWTFTGGVARYVQQLMDGHALDRESMIRFIFQEGSSFIDEGLMILVQEFGKDYGIYFSILSAIAAGATDHAQIKNEIGTDVGTFLSRLENDYSLVRRKVPLFADIRQKNSHYQIDDCFFRFWFRFVYKYQYLVELGRFDKLQEVVRRDFNVFSGFALERYFQWQFLESTSYTRMDAWWDRKGENEIDLVCEDEFSNRLDFYEIKRDPARIDLELLRRKAEAFFAKNPTLAQRVTNFKGLSLDDL